MINDFYYFFRYGKVKAVSDDWVGKVNTLLKEWTLLDNTVTELNTWVAKVRLEKCNIIK